MKNNFFSPQSKEKPQICAIDLDKEIVEALQAKNLHCFEATLGSPIKVPEYGNKSYHPCRPNSNFPPNLHEYDIVIVDLQDRQPIEYIESEHISPFLQGGLLLSSKYPEPIFDPRPLSSLFLRAQLEEFFTKETLTIIFCSSDQLSTYYPIQLTYNGCVGEKSIESSLYEFIRDLPNKHNKIGKNVVVADNISKNFDIFLDKYRKKFFYKVIFQWRTQLLDIDGKGRRQRIPKEHFVPLLLNSSNEIVGFFDFSEISVVLVFPQLHDSKKEFLLELIDELLPELFPNIFPYSEQFSWLNSENYFLPNEANIVSRKTKLEDEHKAALIEVEKEFQKNRQKYKFLHNLITETGEELVKSIEKFFIWLGFEKIVNMDEANPKIKDEDIQITLEKGLLVIEVKGIGGTSKDSECGQIGKIKHRRAEERNSFDVFGLYIVNHQRYLPPIKRKNPPFNPQQIADAKLEKRGLLTTYEIFKLYFYIENGFITKEDARNSLLTYGLVKFKPSKSSLLGFPLEIHHNGKVVILNISNITLYKGASIIVCNDEDWFRTEIVELRVSSDEISEKTVESVSEGEIGVNLSGKVLKTSELWLEDTK